METGDPQELIIAITIGGGVLLAGVLIIIALLMWRRMEKNRFDKLKHNHELYGEKERKNGQQKGGSRGKF